MVTIPTFTNPQPSVRLPSSAHARVRHSGKKEKKESYQQTQTMAPNNTQAQLISPLKPLCTADNKTAFSWYLNINTPGRASFAHVDFHLHAVCNFSLWRIVDACLCLAATWKYLPFFIKSEFNRRLANCGIWKFWLGGASHRSIKRVQPYLFVHPSIYTPKWFRNVSFWVLRSPENTRAR